MGEAVINHELFCLCCRKPNRRYPHRRKNERTEKVGESKGVVGRRSSRHSPKVANLKFFARLRYFIFRFYPDGRAAADFVCSGRSNVSTAPANDDYNSTGAGSFSNRSANNDENHQVVASWSNKRLSDHGGGAALLTHLADIFVDEGRHREATSHRRKLPRCCCSPAGQFRRFVTPKSAVVAASVFV